MCTGIRLKAQDNSIIYARTLEFAQEINSEIIMIPHEYDFIGIGPTGKADGLRWKTKYAVVGTNAAQQTIIIDGINEKGLAGGLFYFPDYAQYQEVPSNKVHESIASWQLMTLLLTTCQSINEVKELLSKIYVNNAVFSDWGIIPPIHAIIHDLWGNSLVIEYEQGKLNTYENPSGVFTNSPSFDWHITNLSNYINLDVFNVAEKEMSGLKVKPLGQGSGLLGLPGDFTSPSRFIRACIFSQAVTGIANETSARNACFHLLNLFDIPFGSVRQKEHDKTICERTQWTSACDLKNRRYYYKTYETQIIQEVDLLKMNMDSKQPILMKMK